MTKKRRRNPLSYLGWLGWIGVIGINTGDFLLQFFLIYFFFFGYSWMPADELFWSNVKRSGFRSFIFSTILSSILVILVVIMERVGETPLLVSSIFKSYVFGSFAAVLFFIISLMYYNRQEKRYLEKKND